MRKYVIHFGAAALTSLVMLAGFNWVVDPYKIWNSPVIPGLNATKSELANHERIFKTVGLANRPADTVILGTSRSDIGLRPTHPALGREAINLAMSSQPYLETRMVFDSLTDHKTSGTFVIGFDFFAANSALPEPPDFVFENFADERKCKLITSITTLTDSLRTAIKRKVLLIRDCPLELFPDFCYTMSAHFFDKFLMASIRNNPMESMLFQK